jgi:hypothetical protein
VVNGIRSGRKEDDMTLKNTVLHRVSFGPIAAIALFLCLPTRGAATEPESPDKATYTRYCSSCHGYDGKGKGPVANVLTTKPTDLTEIAKKAGGDFPMMKVIQSIDGSVLVRGHGETDMPVWGERFRAESAAPSSRQAEARGRILLIAEYLRSIQEK